MHIKNIKNGFAQNSKIQYSKSILFRNIFVKIQDGSSFLGE